MIQKKISLCMPNFRHKNEIYDAIESLLKMKIPQGYTLCEILIVDNCSDDGAYELIEEMTKKYPVIKLKRNKENVGLVRNWNAVLENAEGEIVGLFFSDDIYSEQMVESHIRIMNEFNADIVSAPGYFVKNSKKIKWPLIYPMKKILQNSVFFKAEENYPNYLKQSWDFVANSFIVKKELLNRIGLFDQTYNYAPDSSFTMKLLGNANVAFCSLPFHIRRVNKNEYGWLFSENKISGFKKNNYLVEDYIRIAKIIEKKFDELNEIEKKEFKKYKDKYIFGNYRVVLRSLFRMEKYDECDSLLKNMTLLIKGNSIIPLVTKILFQIEKQLISIRANSFFDFYNITLFHFGNILYNLRNNEKIKSSK